MAATAMVIDSLRIDPKSLRSIAASVQKEIELVEQSLSSDRELQAKLSTERELLILPARSKKDKAAQTRLNEIDEQLTPLARNISDEGTIVSFQAGVLDFVAE